MSRRPRDGRAWRAAFLAFAVVVASLTAAIPSPAATTAFVFSDGFESGTLAQWTGKSGMVVQQQEVYAGAWAARGTTTGATAAYAYSSLNPTRTDLYVDLRFKVISQTAGNAGLLRFRTSGAGAIFSIFRRADGRLLYTNEAAGTTVVSSAVVSAGSWHELEVHGLINGTAGAIGVWLDGAPVGDLTRTDNLGTTAMGRVYMGDPSTGKSWDIAFDEVIFSTAFDVQGPTVPGSLAANATSPTQVDLTWSPSTDNVGVTGYTIYRGGVAIGTAGGSATTYSDTTVAGGQTYTYTVDAFDAALNHSAQSAQATVTTPEAADLEPPTIPKNLSATVVSPNRIDLVWTASTDNVGVTGYTVYRDGNVLTQVGVSPSFSDTTVSGNVSYTYTVDAFDAAGNHSAESTPVTATTPGLVFSDGFEDGTLNAWSGKTGMVVQQSQVYSGLWGARGTTTGTASYAYKSLFPSQGDFYTEVALKVLSQANVSVGLIRYRTTTAGSIFSIMRRGDGRLVYYNEVTGASVTSATVITANAWHQVKVHCFINGTSSLMEVWLDGVRLNDVSRTDNLGTSGVGRFYIGDPATGRTWDVAYDQIVLSTATDTIPPAAPTGVGTAVVGSNHVNVTWNPATDASGIAGYTIYRDGSAVGTVAGGTTQYADFAAAANSTMTYTVDAYDPAGNRSVQSSGAQATTGSPSGGDPYIMAAGDIACDPANGNFNGGLGTPDACRQKYTSDLLFASNPAAILALGDTQYEDGQYSKFLASYDPAWGRVRSNTYPLPGNHEYLSGAAGYFAYFGAAAGDPTKGYYSFDVGTWHIIMLNDACAAVGGCGSTSPQGQWLAADLAAHPTTCTLAAWHAPAFSSGFHGNSGDGITLFQQLDAGGVDVVLNGHDHDYERFAKQNSFQQADPNGIRSIVVGTGGDEHEPAGNLQPNSQVLNLDTYGVLKLTLHPSSYDWTFIPEAGKTFTDSGTDSCV